MPEPRHERIMVALVGVLQGIVADGGVTYHYTPDLVIRSPSLHGGCFNTQYTCIYVVSQDGTARAQRTTRQKDGDIRFDLTVLLQLPTAFKDDNPFFAGQTLRETYQARLAADAEKALIADPAFNAFPGLEVWRIQVTDDDRSAENTNFEGWACAFLRCLINYKYPITDP